MNPSTPVVFERDNVNDESVTLVRWFVQHGDQVALNALLAEVETSKANVEVYAPAAGYVEHRFAEGAEVPVEAAIAHISDRPPSTEQPDAFAAPDRVAPQDDGRRAAAEPQATPSQTATPELQLDTEQLFVGAATDRKQRFSPVAAKMMQTHDVPEAAFAGKSVVRKQDILDYLDPPAPVAAAEAPVTGKRNPAPRITQPYRAVPLSKMKRREGASLAAGVGNAVPSAVSVTCFTRGLRRILAQTLDGANPSAVIVYEVARLLRKYPELNSVYSEGSMLQYEQVNVAFAMDDGRGIKAAVLPETDTLSLQAAAAMLRELTVNYLEDKLSPAQMANATFTVSDLSGLGVSSFFPLMLENQGAILGVGGEQFAPGSAQGFYTLTLTFDHQLSNGRTAALFLNDLKERLQNYESATETAGTGTGTVCGRCYRDAAELKRMKVSLLRSAEPDGYLCELCAGGW